MPSAPPARRLLTTCAAIAVGLSAAACSSAGIRDAYMARDSEGNWETEVFPDVGSEIHCIIDMVNFEKGTILRIKLAPPGGAEVRLDESTLAPSVGDNLIDFQLGVVQPPPGGEPVPDSPELAFEGPWPVGRYKLEILLDDEVEETLEFRVK